MGIGTMKCKNYITKPGYYLVKDYDSKVGGEFYFLLLPLYGNDGEMFYCVKENADGSFTVDGEFYIITNEESLKSYLKDAKKDLAGKTLWYYHTDGNGKTVRKERREINGRRNSAETVLLGERLGR